MFICLDSKSISVSWINNELVVSWNDIFTSIDQLFYEVSAGTMEGGVNIIQWQYTNQTSITFGIPPTVTVATGLKVHVTVGAITVGGNYGFKTGSITLP